MEELAEFLRNYVDTENIREWLEHEPILTSEYIEEFLAKYYPDLAAQFISFLAFNIPSAYGVAPEFTYVYGTHQFQDLDGSIDPINNIKVCAFDRDESNPDPDNDEQLYSGQTAVCDFTDNSGFFAMGVPSDALFPKPN